MAEGNLKPNLRHVYVTILSQLEEVSHIPKYVYILAIQVNGQDKNTWPKGTHEILWKGYK